MQTKSSLILTAGMVLSALVLGYAIKDIRKSYLGY